MKYRLHSRIGETNFVTKKEYDFPEDTEKAVRDFVKKHFYNRATITAINTDDPAHIRVSMTLDITIGIIEITPKQHKPQSQIVAEKKRGTVSGEIKFFTADKKCHCAVVDRFPKKFLDYDLNDPAQHAEVVKWINDTYVLDTPAIELSDWREF